MDFQLEIRAPWEAASSARRRHALLAMLCALCVVTVSTLAQAADRGETTRSRMTFAAPPVELTLQIGALSEQLFDAAIASRWPAARLSLQALNRNAKLLDASYEDRFLAAGGDLEDLQAVRERLDRRLAEADDAIAGQDPQALEEVANRITLIAGELAQPFAENRDSPAALKISAAMFQARRMLESLASGDQPGYESAHAKFQALWLALRDFSGIESAKLAALDRALTNAALYRSDDADRELQGAAQDALGVRTSFAPMQ